MSGFVALFIEKQKNFCRWVVSERPKVRIVALTVHDEYSVIQRMLAKFGVNNTVSLVLREHIL